MGGLLRLRARIGLAMLLGCATFSACGDDDDTEDDSGSASSSVMRRNATDSDGKASSESSKGASADCDPTAKEVEIDEDLTEDTTWDCGTYYLQKIIFVRGDATLTIEPGVQVLGDTDVSGEVAALIVTRGSKLQAVGTPDAPIVFSSANPEGARAPGDWGGLVLLGNATINTGSCHEGEGDACTGGYFEDNVNGLDPTNSGSVYGGRDDRWNCGHLEYARVEYAGYELSPDNELNGLSVGACGTETKLSYIQVHFGADDAIEFFGGTAGIDHALVTAGADDGIDWDYGWRGDAQFVIVHQRTTGGDHALEGDNLAVNENATPRSNPRLYNFTLIGNPSKSAILLRSGTHGELRNFLVSGFASAVDLDTSQSTLDELWPEQLSIEHSVFFDNDSAGDPDEMDDDGDFDEDEAVRAAARNNVFDVDPELTPDVDGPSYLPGSDSLGEKATPPSELDSAASYAGAVDPDGEDWTQGWTTHASN